MDSNISNPKYGIQTIHNVQFSTIKTIKEFNYVYDELINKKLYYSVTAEKKRLFQLKDTLKIYPTEIGSVFGKVVKSYLYNINKDIKMKDLDKVTFLKSQKTQEVSKILDYKKNEIFSHAYIKDDVVYTNEFLIITNKKQTKAKLRIINKIYAPMTLDSMSIKAMSMKIDFKKRFKLYSQQIKNQVRK